jgi:hypothetical protein
MKNHRWLLVCLIFFLVIIIYGLSRVRTPSDSRWSLPVAFSLLREGNLNLDEYQQEIKQNNYYGVEKIRGHWYSRFPPGVAFLIAPVVPVIKWGAAFTGISEEKLLTSETSSRIELILASAIVALTAVVIYLILLNFTNDNRILLLLTFVFAFCSPAWSTASRALWQHGPSMLMLSLSLYLLLKSQKNPALISWLGLPLTFSCIIRPTNELSLLLLGGYVLIKHRKYFLLFLVGVGVILIPFLVRNYLVLGSCLPGYYQLTRIGSVGQLPEALAGNLLSPARGLFIFCPVFLFSFYGVYLKIKRRSLNHLDMTLLLIIFFHWLLISSFPHWWGGASYGPRFFSDLVPFLIYFLVPAVSFLFQAEEKKFLRCIFFLALLFSFYTNFHGATSWKGYWWNREPANVDQHPRRLWDWHHPQFF